MMMTIMMIPLCTVCGQSYSEGGSTETWVCCVTTNDADGYPVDGCGGWFHLKCTDLNDHNLTKKELEVMTWHCQACTAVASLQDDADF